MKETINLYLDDLRDCPKGFLVARNMEEAIYYLNNYKVNILSLDHDLGMNEKTGEILPTGYDLVKYMCENGLSVNKVYLHTDNVCGRDNMYHTLLAARKRGFLPQSMKIYHYPITENKYSGT